MAESRRARKEVRDQERPSLGRSLEFCLSSIRHRFFRSAVTLSVVVLAVAFLMNILTETIIAGSVARGVHTEFEKLYVADLFERRITPDTALHGPGSQAEELSTLRAGSPRWLELERWSGLGKDGFKSMVEMARKEMAYTSFFDTLDFGRRRALAGRTQGAQLFDELAAPEAQTRLAEKLHSPEMASLSIPGEASGLLDFVKAWPAYRAQLESLQQTLAGVLVKLEARLKTPLDKALDQAAKDPARRVELLAALTGEGFEITAGELSDICEERHKLAVLKVFRVYVADPEFRSHWPDLKIPGDFTPEALLKHYLDDSRVPAWLKLHANNVATRRTDPLPVTRDELQEIANRYREHVQEAGKGLAHLADGEVGKSDRQKKFITYVTEHPQFAEAWPKIAPDEPFSLESLLWRYNDDRTVRRWLVETAKSTGATLPCTEDDIRTLSDAYLSWVQKRGLQKAPAEAAAENDPKFMALIEYLKDPEYKAGWDGLGISTDFSPDAVILYCGAGDRTHRVIGYVQSIARRISSRVKAPLPASAAEIQQIAEMEKNRERVRTMQSELSARGTVSEGISERTFWLIAVSFLVCVVGIANAMLMAVTERFREIATMKCLGALDEFIMTIFLIESGLQGFMGATLGVLLGFMLALIRCGMSFGFYTTSYFPWADVLRNTAISTGAGMLLAVLAAVYPAWVASRMAPMEAMRVE